MNELFTPQWYKEQCEKLLMRPEKERGQHFLVNRTIAAKIADAGELSTTDTVLEIGPGFGVLTTELVARAGNVIAVDADKKFEKVLGIQFLFINKDILEFDERTLPKDYILISNLPYSITSNVLEKFLLSDNPPARIVLMLQKEVVVRMTAKPPKMNRLAILTQLYGVAKLVCNVSAGNFWPLPKVESAVVLIEPYAEGKGFVATLQDAGKSKSEFLSFVAAGFSSPRKKLANNLESLIKNSRESLVQVGINPNARPEEVEIKKWIELFLCAMQ